MFCSVPQRTIPYQTVTFCTRLHHSTPDFTTLYQTLPLHQNVPICTRLNHCTTLQLFQCTTPPGRPSALATSSLRVSVWWPGGNSSTSVFSTSISSTASTLQIIFYIINLSANIHIINIITKFMNRLVTSGNFLLATSGKTAQTMVLQ